MLDPKCNEWMNNVYVIQLLSRTAYRLLVATFTIVKHDWYQHAESIWGNVIYSRMSWYILTFWHLSYWILTSMKIMVSIKKQKNFCRMQKSAFYVMGPHHDSNDAGMCIMNVILSDNIPFRQRGGETHDSSYVKVWMTPYRWLYAKETSTSAMTLRLFLYYAMNIVNLFELELE